MDFILLKVTHWLKQIWIWQEAQQAAQKDRFLYRKFASPEKYLWQPKILRPKCICRQAKIKVRSRKIKKRRHLWVLKWRASTQIATSKTKQPHLRLLMATTRRKHVKGWCHCARIGRSDSSPRDFWVKSQFKPCTKRMFRKNALRKRTTLTKVQFLNKPIR